MVENKIKNVQEMLYLKNDSKLVHSVKVGESLAKTIDTMKKFKIGSIAIVNNENKLIGIFSERDLLKQCFEDGKFIDITGRTVDEFMTYSPHSAYPTDSLASCVASFLMAKSRHIPIVDEENRLIGMLSIKDVFENLSFILQDQLLEQQEKEEDPQA